MASATRDRIKEHARAIGYIYNRRAASLRTSRSGIVGVVVHDIMNPFFAEILKSIETELDRSRQTFILSNHYDQLEKQRTFIDTLLQLGADGVIMSPAIGTPPEDIRMAEENGLPAVLIARTVEGAGVPAFRGDDRYGTGLATNHLISLGHRRIAMIGGTDQTSTGRDRYQGYVNALQKAGMSIDDIDVFECNEAFASVPLAWMQELGVPHEKVNLYGGGIALGHPIGATGARLMTTLLNVLERTGGRYGLQTMCEGGGQANVTIVERL